MVAVFTICAFAVVLILIGSFITGLVLKEPDICWLLASGKWIVTHGQLPQSDPFSYTGHYLGAPYVIEKWLAEVIFYQAYAWTGIAGLLVLDALIVCVTFIILPMRMAYLCGWRGGRALLIAFLVGWNSLSHICVRPEEFSFLLLAVSFESITRSARRTQGNAKIDWLNIGVIALVSCLWANLHTLFLVTMLLTGLYFGCSILERALPEMKGKPFNFTPMLMFVVSILATLLNPYGFALWTYMPFIFGKFTETNNEMQPIKWATAYSMTFWPFYIMMLWSFRALFKNGLKRPFEQGGLFFRLLVLTGTIGGFKTVRTIPISGLFFAAALTELYKKTQTEGNDAPVDQGLFKAISDRLTELADPMSTKFPAFCIGVMCLSTYLMTYVVTPEIPQGSKAFEVPGAAIEYIAKHPPHGNQLNDPHFGAVLEWRVDNNPPVFIDPRYNLFGNDLLQDYWKMVQCGPGWQALLQKYDIQWVFVQPQYELPKRLAVDSSWKCLFSDKYSVIYSRNRLDK